MRIPLTTAAQFDPIIHHHVKALHIHINHDGLLEIARHILLLKTISSPDFDPQVEVDMDYLWDLWYQATWPDSTLKRFQADVHSLLDEPLPGNILIPNGSHNEDELRTVWTGWLSMVHSISVEHVLSDRYFRKKKT